MHSFLPVIILFELIAAGFLAFGIWLLKEQNRKLNTFLPIQVRMLSFSVAEHKDSDDNTYYTPRLSYEYEVGGQTHQGGSYTPVSSSFASRAAVEKIGQAYPVGQTCQGFYNPEKPGESYLVAKKSIAPYLMMGVAVFLMVMGLALAGFLL